MRLLSINLENFRNIEFAALRLGEQSHLLLGANGQGKTNLLEAIGLLAAVRSFRTQDMGALIRSGQTTARIVYGIKHERFGITEVEIVLSQRSKTLILNGETITRMADFIGLLPIVVLASDDIQLLRGSPQLRRRFLDMTLSAIDTEYFTVLRRYHRTLKERNSLLRNETIDFNTLSAFEKLLAPDAYALVQKRSNGLALLSDKLNQYCTAVCGIDEGAELVYRPNAEFASTEAALSLLQNQRAKDRLFKSTQRGPHRDDLQFKLKGTLAREFASEGQQRGLVIGLKMALIEQIEAVQSITPVVLADDVLGEFDSKRRDGFWNALGAQRQIIATGTTLPVADQTRTWQVKHVAQGTFSDE